MSRDMKMVFKSVLSRQCCRQPLKQHCVIFGFWIRYACATRDAVVNNRRSSLKGTRRAMLVLRNIEARSYNHCCRGKALSITYSECVFVALGIQHAPHCHLWSVQLYNIFLRYFIYGVILYKRLFIIKCVFWFSLLLLSETCLILKSN